MNPIAEQGVVETQWVRSYANQGYCQHFTEAMQAQAVLKGASESTHGRAGERRFLIWDPILPENI